MKRQLLAGAFACFLGFLTTNAFAGHYTAGTTSGITFTASPGGGSPVFGSGTVTGQVGGGGGSCSVGGTASTTFTWVPDYTGEPAPSSVIVIEHCKVWTDAKTYPYAASAGGGTADNGLGTNWSATTDVTSGIGAGTPYGKDRVVTSDGYSAQIKSGASSVTVNSCSPSASASSYNGSYAANIDYSVSVYPLTLTIDGAITVNHNYEILPGQLATFHLSNSAPGVSAGGSSTPYDWSNSSDNNIFASFAGSDSSGVRTDVSTATKQSASPSWRYVHDDVSTITCEVQLVYQVGSFSSASIGSAEVTRVLNVVEVPATLANTYQSLGSFSASGGDLLLTSAPLPPDTGDAMASTYSASMPTDFLDYGWGHVGYVQLLLNTGYYATVNGDEGTAITSGTGFANDRGSNNTSTDMVYPYSDGWVIANGSLSGTALDDPAFGMTDASYLSQMRTDFHAKDYLFFSAPGDSNPVPLLFCGWSWIAQATKTSGVWAQDSNTVSQSTATTKALGHPQWDHKLYIPHG